ncbi:MAG TPA: methyltransferase, partial [Pseudonocardia sp.]
LDRICAGVPDVLAPDGHVLIVHSAVCDVDMTVEALQQAGLSPEVLARASLPFGPVMRSRAALLESRGLIHPGQRFEELVVLGARHA